jgi:hypothetical protein
VGHGPSFVVMTMALRGDMLSVTASPRISTPTPLPLKWSWR